MNITLVLVGRTTQEPLQKLIDTYVGRLQHYATFQVETIKDLTANNLTTDQIKAKEGELILKKIPSSAYLILLDERGKMYSSVDFATFLQQTNQTYPSKNICFVVGGAFGFSQNVYARADAMLSLSKMTFTHQMIRLLFVEQLYRAFTIINGEKYHHE